MNGLAGLIAAFEPPTTKDFVWGCWGPSLKIGSLSFCMNFINFLVLFGMVLFIAFFYFGLRRTKVVPTKTQSLAEMGIDFVRAKVGDRYVLEDLVSRGWECGGENSGHILCLDRHSTGDAIISSLQVLAAVVSSQQSLSEFTRELKLLPQVLVNVKLAGKLDLQAPTVRDAVTRAEADLKGRGRVLLRPSGTEPVVRVMVEGEDRAHVQELADAIAKVVKTAAARAAA